MLARCACVAFAVAVTTACATSAPRQGVSGAAPAIRVLVAAGAGPFRVSGTDAGDVTVSATPSGVRVDGATHDGTVRLEGAALAVNGLRVRGVVDVERTASGLAVVNELPLEDYVAGVLARETYTGWGPEVLRAQAVVARTYALHERGRRADAPFDLRATTASQVYGGVAAENDAVLEAIRATRGEYLSFDGEPILAVYHAASGGETAAADEVWRETRPYLAPVEVAGEELSPDTYWRAPVSRERLAAIAAAAGRPVGAVRDVRIEERTPSGRVRSVHISGSEGDALVPADRLRAALGERVLKSTRFEIRPGREPRPDEIVFVGSGRGHGVGMSQWGARAMALRGAGYREILAHFYPGTTLRRAREGWQ